MHSAFEYLMLAMALTQLARALYVKRDAPLTHLVPSAEENLSDRAHRNPIANIHHHHSFSFGNLAARD
jgi:hypothetical protein